MTIQFKGNFSFAQLKTLNPYIEAAELDLLILQIGTSITICNCIITKKTPEILEVESLSN